MWYENMVKGEIEREKKRKLRKKRLGLVGLTAYYSKCGNLAPAKLPAPGNLA